ncbi:CCA tRNA nucleotidyltransferase [Natranaeroarchaeum sulfidigenes]|uniref:CCA-adding enzyme n=1 Tax=Natranaeroarchaeum sulfidigenes TaxID=2784880 RepID=A0A897MHD2_9EURY|nr:CCA tRNA nucleotidyltransferase [Natranaeroarchaeum sulfidigenes]QSG01560.1 tRNA nucleotidyltransferase (CCA-adding enzyme) [Natranaeroarchaeum sulfidigenes]
MMSEAETFEEVVAAVSESVDPSPEEVERMERVATALIGRVEAAIETLPVEADVVRVGSTARETWISGDRDIDLFVRFSPSIERDALEKYGLAVGHEVLPDGTEEFAEHPYVKSTVDGFDIDLVPCYAVDDPGEIKSSVDRTPFHAEYVQSRLTDELARDVRLAKQFFTGIGVYGSDLRTEGFSGYLTELLVLEYGGFRPMVEAAAAWHPPIELDPEDHGRVTFDDPLTVIDPTDPGRNVAAVLSADNVARLQHYARELLDDPRTELFAAVEPDPLDEHALREQLQNRGTTPVAIRFDAPDIVEDQLYPQLRRSRLGIIEELDRRGFTVCRSMAIADETAVLFAELAVTERPRVERHVGPPVHVRDHAEGFFRKYEGTDAYGPFIEGDRYVVERSREYTTAEAFLNSDDLFTVRLGTHVETALDSGYDVLVGEEITVLIDEFGVELAAYFDPSP